MYPDNAPWHKAKVAQEWLEEHNNEFEVINWPPNSEEHLWDVLNKRVPSIEAPPHNLQDLKDALTGQFVMAAKEGPTEYLECGQCYA